MPVKIADGLPAQSILENEHIFIMTEHRALHQDHTSAEDRHTEPHADQGRD